MIWDRRGSSRRSNDAAGITLVEAVVLAVVLLAALLFLVWSADRAATRARREACRQKLLILCRGVKTYISCSEEFFPPAWHVSGPSVAEDLSDLSYHRLILHEYCESSFSWRGVGRLAEAQEAFRQNALFWSDPERGWTRDYFAPEIVFRLPEQQGKAFDGHADYTELTDSVASVDRPLFADVNASVPDPSANAEANGGETRNGIAGRFTNVFGLNVFFGVARSQRVEGDLSTLRFDFRHGSAANVLFLDGHVECVKAIDRARLEQVSRNWDHLKPPAEASPK